jgi:hypothetical protein
MDTYLHQIVSASGVLPSDACQVVDVGKVPATLRRVISLARDIGQSCCCWRDERQRHYLFSAEMSPELSKRRGAPVLHLDEYDDHGLKGTSSWMLTHDGKWLRCDKD